MPKKVFVFGTFDVFHLGHQFVLSQACLRGTVFVTVAQDATVLKIKGSLPRHSLPVRMAAIQAAFPAVKVIAGSTHNYLESITSHQPDLILLGYDQNLPPGITAADLQVPVERLPAFMPETYKSSLFKKEGT